VADRDSMRLYRTIRQWRRWSLPSKLTFVGVVLGVISIALGLLPLAPMRRSAAPSFLVKIGSHHRVIDVQQTSSGTHFKATWFDPLRANCRYRVQELLFSNQTILRDPEITTSIIYVVTNQGGGPARDVRVQLSVPGIAWKVALVGNVTAKVDERGGTSWGDRGIVVSTMPAGAHLAIVLSVSRVGPRVVTERLHVDIPPTVQIGAEHYPATSVPLLVSTASAISMIVDSLANAGFSSTFSMQLNGVVGRGWAYRKARILEEEGLPQLSRTGTCSYNGPPKSAVDLDAIPWTVDSLFAYPRRMTREEVTQALVGAGWRIDLAVDTVAVLISPTTAETLRLRGSPDGVFEGDTLKLILARIRRQ